MAIFVLADTHLSQNLDKEMDVFGKRWEGYTEKLVRGWRQSVGQGDTVIVPGDISWGMTLTDAEPGLRLLDSLPGNKILGRGNHDFWWGSAAKMRAFLEKGGMHSIRFLYNNAFIVENHLIVGTRGWFYDEKGSPKDTDFDKIVAREAGRLELSIQAADRLPDASRAEEMLCFLHFPPIFKGQLCRPLIDVMHRHGIKRCYYGHIHGVYDLPPSHTFEGITFRIVSADYLHFTPLLIEPNREGSENIDGKVLTFQENMV